MKYCLFLLVGLWFCVALQAQKKSLDSLLAVTETLPADSNKVLNYIQISNKYRIEFIQHDLAKKYALQALELGKKIGFDKGVFKASIAHAYVTRDKGAHKEGIELLQKAIDFFEHSKQLLQDKSMLTSWVYAYTALADLCTYLPDYASAQRFAFKAIEIAEQHEQIGIGQCWITLSIIFFKEKNLSQANVYADKALGYFSAKKSWDDIGRVLAYQARYAYVAEEPHKAIAKYLESYQAYEKVKSVFGMRIACYNIAEIYLKLKYFDKATYYINETIRLNNSANDAVYLFYINDLKFKIESENRQYAAALQTAKLLLQFAEKEKNLTNISLASTYLKKTYLALGDTTNAYKLSEQVSALKDSLYNADLAKNTDELARKYDTKAKEQRIQFLNAENKLHQEK